MKTRKKATASRGQTRDGRPVIPRERLHHCVIRMALMVLLGFFTVHAESAILPPNVTLYSAAFGNGTFVSVGAGGAIYSSVNGGPWTQRVSGMTNRLDSVAF